MATNDQEVVSEVRALTGYDTDNVFTDADVQEILEICKDEVRTDIGEPEYQFFTGNLYLDRALFWFTCIGLKIKAGEIGSGNITIEGLQFSDSDSEYRVWFSNYEQKRRNGVAELSNLGAATSTLGRTDRSYEYDRPDN